MGVGSTPTEAAIPIEGKDCTCHIVIIRRARERDAQQMREKNAAAGVYGFVFSRRARCFRKTRPRT